MGVPPVPLAPALSTFVVNPDIFAEQVDSDVGSDDDDEASNSADLERVRSAMGSFVAFNS
jgi:hypothetical protein